MPTGYTAGILDGEVKDFKQFATLCMRAFGATIHMRDENLDKPYEPRVPSNYHQERIDEANKLLQLAQNLTDEEIVTRREEELQKSKSYHIKSIEKVHQNWERLNAILIQAENYKPPTDDHNGIKSFMIDQLKQTLELDGSDKYHREKLAEINQELNNLNPAVIRSQMLASAEHDLQYHQEELRKEIKRCEDSNKWVEGFLASLE